MLLGEREQEVGNGVVTIRTLEIVNQKIPSDYRLCLGVEIGDDCHFLAVVENILRLAVGQSDGFVMLFAER